MMKTLLPHSAPVPARHRAAIACLLTILCLAPGCGNQETPTPPPPPSDADSGNTTPPAAGFVPTDPAEAALTALTNSFQEAPAQTQQRVFEAVESLKTGDAREAVTRLKTIDADSELTLPQQQSIREVIRAHRSQLTPTP